MSNSIGNSVILTLFGESHGPETGAVLDGMAAGIPISEEEISDWLLQRRPRSSTETARHERDNFHIVSGVFNGYTTGAPICITIPNEDVRSGDYEAFHGLARPSHADYVAHVKYHGYEDYRGGGHFSGRITAPLVAVGAIAMKALNQKGIFIGTHILRCGGICDAPFSTTEIQPVEQPEEAKHLQEKLVKEIKWVNTHDFPVISHVEKQMSAAIQQARNERDSIGGVVQTAVAGLPTGVGKPWFDSVEGCIARAVFAIGGVKGVEFGTGFSLADLRGSQANDSFFINEGKVQTRTNHSGGINGGITNGMPIVFNTAVKPTSSIARTQHTIDFLKGVDADLLLKGRHDPAIVRRICPVITSMTAIVSCDMLAMEYGTDYLSHA